jgi:hypothetical protein
VVAAVAVMDLPPKEKGPRCGPGNVVGCVIFVSAAESAFSAAIALATWRCLPRYAELHRG